MEEVLSHCNQSFFKKKSVNIKVIKECIKPIVLLKQLPLW